MQPATSRISHPTVQTAAVPAPSKVDIREFDSRLAGMICGWIDGDATLRLLAPGTSPPLTPAKVLEWAKPGGFAATGWIAGVSGPIAYGEINPMRRRSGHFWLGHVIVRPGFRRRGHGLSFVRELVRYAVERRQAREIALVVFPENTAAIECYLRVGFRAAGEEVHRFRVDGPEERLLRLELPRERLGYAS